MRLLEINLATRPVRNNTLYWAGFGSGAAIVAGLTVLNLWLFLGYGASMQQHRQELGEKKQRQDRFSRDEQRLSGKLAKLDFKGLAQQAEFANDAIRRRIFSWTELFNRLEEVVPPTVMMSAIRPEIGAEGISIIIEGAAKDQGALLDFESNLIASAYFARIYPGSERREQRDQDLRFSLRFDYLPEGRPGVPTTPARRPPEVRAQESPAPAPAPPVSPNPIPPGNGLPTALAAPAPGPSPATRSPISPTVPPANPSSIPPAGGNPAVATNVPAPSPAPPAHPPMTGGRTGERTTDGVPPPRVSRTVPRRDALRPGASRGARPAPYGQAAMYQPPAPDPAANFTNAQLSEVLEFLSNKRSLTFIFTSDFDLTQKVTADLAGKGEAELVAFVAAVLDAEVSREAEHVYKVQPKSGGEPLEEPPVEEQPVPDNAGDNPEKSPDDPGKPS